MTPHAFQSFPVPTPPAVAIESLRDLPVPLQLAVGAVDVWSLPVAFLASQRAALAASLSDDERARRARFARAEDGLRFELFHGALRRILAGYVGVEPAVLAFASGPGGKPGLASPGARGLEFNLSHTGDLMVLACTRDGRVGVDAEQMDARTDVDALAARFFHPRERAALAELYVAARQVRFFQWWTAREAWLKARGEGLNDELAELDFSRWANVPWQMLVDQDGARWLAWSFGGGDAWTGTLVVEPAPRLIRWRTPA